MFEIKMKSVGDRLRKSLIEINERGIYTFLYNAQV